MIKPTRRLLAVVAGLALAAGLALGAAPTADASVRPAAAHPLQICWPDGCF